MKKTFWIMIPACCLIFLGILVAAALYGRTVTVISQNASLTDRHCFILDAGHGGIDCGAVSCTGVFESKINLEIALRLNDLFHLLGYDTVMIRTADTSIYIQGNTIAAQKSSDLKERVRIVNETKNGILLSIHQNHFSDSYYHGAQMFYAKTEGSKELAGLMQTAFVTALNPGSNRKEKQAEGIYLMKHIDKPGILIECGFLSNHEEEAKLKKVDYQKKICCVIVSACSQYCNSNPITEMN